MKHVTETSVNFASVLQCTNCCDQFCIKDGDWPFWLHIALREAFMATHKDCRDMLEPGKHTRYETVQIHLDDPYERLR